MNNGDEEKFGDEKNTDFDFIFNPSLVEYEENY
jgi:hypothetical protein